MKRKITHSHNRKLYRCVAMALMCLLSLNITYAQVTATINCTGTAGSFNSGSVNFGGTKNDGNMITINTSSNKGWGRFDLSGLPLNATITSANVVFTTYSSTLSGASNNVYGFLGDPSVIPGSDLYDSCSTGASFNSSTWAANTTNMKALNAAGVSFLNTNIAGSVNLGFVRASTNTYNIYGYPGSAANQPQLQISYSVNAAMIYDSSKADLKVSTPVIQGGTDIQILRFNIFTTGVLTPLSLSDVTIGTGGTTTSLSDITGLKVYYTGSDPSFSTATQLGSTLTSVSASQSVSGTQTLGEGNNYFWVAYDISATATAGSLLDAEVTGVTVSGSAYTPVVTSLPGTREVQSPMAYVSSFATQTFTSKVFPGSFDQPIIGIGVVMSSTGLPVNIDSLIFNTNGTTSATDIADARVWYTGSSNVFSTSTLYGSVGSTPSSPFTISGTLSLLNDTNYFWLVYDLDPGAVTFDTLDAEVVTAGINGSTFTPTITAPSGSRTIDYCISTAVSTGDEEITNVSFGSMNSSSTCSTTGGPGSSFNEYSDYTTIVTPPNVLRCAHVPLSITTGTCGSFYGEVLAAYVDWNQDGDFDDADEQLFSTPYTTGSPNLVRGTIVTIPSTAAIGLSRMRIVYNEDFSAPACGEYGFGETEDYLINVMDNPPTFVFGTANQIAGSVSPGTADAPVLHIPVLADACDTMIATTFNFNTAGTTNPSDIVNAKLYVTGNSATFNTSKLVGTVSAPSGVFTFSVLDTLVNNDTTNYWLAYDISASSTLGNTIDAVFDSVEAVGAYHLPTTGNPAGNILIQAPMTYVSSSTSQNDLSLVVENSTNNMIIGMTVITSSVGAPIHVTNFDFNANGTTDTASIRNIKVWYTGNSKVFAATNQFGSTLPGLPGVSLLDFSITGSQALATDTNYFWLTYDIPLGAALDSVVDAECTSITVEGSPQTPTSTAPAGTRKIRADYCIPGYSDGSFSCLLDGYINSVSTTGGSTNISNLNTGCLSTPTQYFYYAGQTVTVSQNGTFDISIEDIGFDEQDYGVWIDYNQNGIFEASEKVFASSATSFVTGSITVPCSAIPGLTRLRVRSVWFGTPVNACDDYFDGEGEDYDIMILPTPAVFNSTTAIQQTSTAGISQTDAKVLRIPVVSTGCTAALSTNFHFNTIGTTMVGDIANAKLYETGNSPVFNTSKLIGTVPSPSGAFNFTVSDTLVSSDTTNYWLAYDISGSATLGNVVDARFDSVETIGAYYLPVVGSPAGSVLIDVPMTYTTSVVTQNNLTKVGQGTANNSIASIEITTSATGSTIPVTSFDISTTGTTLLTDITNLKVWYTGSSSTFATTNQFGSTVASPAAAQTVSGSQNLLNGINYFWVTYDIAPGAIVTNLVDAEISALIAGGFGETPTVTAPAGSRQIRTGYCTPSYITGTSDGDFITKVNLGSINNITGPSSSPYYTFYNTLTTNLNRGGYYNITLSAGSYTDNDMAAWIDFNDDGTFSADEKLGEIEGIGSAPAQQSLTFAVPLTTPLGTLQMRVVEAYDGAPGMDACGAYDYGETEDYTVTILPAPPSATYMWNQTTPADFNIAGNWTPARTNPNMSDVLEFNAGGSPVVENLPEHAVSQVIVDNNTEVTFSTNDIGNLTATDSLTLTSGKITTDIFVNLTLGASGASTGVLSGTGSIEGMFTRWIAAATGTYSFPMISGTDSRAASVNYTAAPTTAGKLTVEFVQGAPGTSGLPVVDAGLNLVNIADAGIWRASDDGVLAGGTYDVTINADAVAGVFDYTQTALLSRANSSSSWIGVGTQVATGGSNTAMILGRTGLNLYGEMGIAGTIVNPLPVKLISLKAVSQSGNAMLSWTTASEINNKGFEVERSVDGHSFDYAGFVKGTGNSSRAVNYSFTDAKAFAKNNTNLLYYRLKQVDEDGRSVYSNTVNVIENAQKTNQVSVYPNPFNDTYSISFESLNAGTVAIKMVDLQGRIVTERSANTIKGINQLSMDNLHAIQSGVYFIKVTVDGETQVFKLVKN